MHPTIPSALALSKMSHVWMPPIRKDVVQFLNSKNSKPWTALWKFSLNLLSEICCWRYLPWGLLANTLRLWGTTQFRQHGQDVSFILICLCTWFITSPQITSWCAILHACSTLRNESFSKDFKEDRFSSKCSGREKGLFWHTFMLWLLQKH